MKQVNQMIMLFLDFLKFGCFTFGGGMSIIAQMQSLYIQKRKTLTNEELLDLMSVARSLPGMMICNVSMLFGYRCCGLFGGLICLLGMVIPPFLIMIAVAYFYSAFAGNYWLSAAMTGVRAAVAPICLSAALGLLDGAYHYPPCIMISVLAFVMYFVFNLNNVFIILFAALCGLLICNYYERGGVK